MEERYWGLTTIYLSVLLIVQLYQTAQIKEYVVSVVETLALVKGQLLKAREEIVSKLADLEAAVAAAGEPSADVTAALDELRTVAQSLDDVVPDAVVEDAPVEVEVEDAPAVESEV